MEQNKEQNKKQVISTNNNCGEGKNESHFNNG